MNYDPRRSMGRELSTDAHPSPRMRCRHQLVPLCPRPETAEGRVNSLFCPLTQYVVCKQCGRVGWYTKHGRLAGCSAEDSDRKREEAHQWGLTGGAKTQPTEVLFDYLRISVQIGEGFFGQGLYEELDARGGQLTDDQAEELKYLKKHLARIRD
jgi:hypothetical protein